MDIPEPTPAELIERLVRLLNVAPAGEDRFTGPRKPDGVGRVFGGQVIAQALVSATRTAPADRPVHSLHAYFLRGGSEDHVVDYTVHRDLDGGSFTNRRVEARQEGKPILTLSASFQRREVGLSHLESPMPQVLPPDDLPREADLRRKAAENMTGPARELMLRPRPIELRAVEARHWMNAEPRPPFSHTWMRAVAPLPDDAALHRAVLAYASDMALLGTSVLPHGLSWANGSLINASLDHAIWFHEPDPRADEWLLYACDSPWSGNGRGFNRGRFFTADGRLVASVAQEGMIRRAKPERQQQ